MKFSPNLRSFTHLICVHSLPSFFCSYSAQFLFILFEYIKFRYKRFLLIFCSFYSNISNLATNTTFLCKISANSLATMESVRSLRRARRSAKRKVLESQPIERATNGNNSGSLFFFRNFQIKNYTLRKMIKYYLLLF